MGKQNCPKCSHPMHKAAPKMYEALKSLQLLADLCFDDIKQSGGIPISHARKYRQARKLAQDIIASYERS